MFFALSDGGGGGNMISRLVNLQDISYWLRCVSSSQTKYTVCVSALLTSHPETVLQ